MRLQPLQCSQPSEAGFKLFWWLLTCIIGSRPFFLTIKHYHFSHFWSRHFPSSKAVTLSPNPLTSMLVLVSQSGPELIFPSSEFFYSSYEGLLAEIGWSFFNLHTPVVRLLDRGEGWREGGPKKLSADWFPDFHICFYFEVSWLEAEFSQLWLGLR